MSPPMCLHLGGNPVDRIAAYVLSLSDNGRPVGLRTCIVFIHLYSASCSAHQSEARETQREEINMMHENRCINASWSK